MPASSTASPAAVTRRSASCTKLPSRRSFAGAIKDARPTLPALRSLPSVLATPSATKAVNSPLSCRSTGSTCAPSMSLPISPCSSVSSASTADSTPLARERLGAGVACGLPPVRLKGGAPSMGTAEGGVLDALPNMLRVGATPRIALAPLAVSCAGGPRRQSAGAALGLMERLIAGGLEPLPLLRHLRVCDWAAFAAASRATKGFGLAASGRPIVPTCKYDCRSVKDVDHASIETLCADQAGFSTPGHTADFATFLSSCNSLQRLYCSHNPKLVMASFAPALGALRGLVVLDLSHGRLAIDDHRNFERPQALEPFFAALPPRLRILDLSYNHLRDAHIELLTAALEAMYDGKTHRTSPPSLEELFLRSNYLGNGTGSALADLVRAGRAGASLWRLDLRANAIDTEGVCAMLSALQSRTSMRELRIGYNRQNVEQDLLCAKLASIALGKAVSCKCRSRLQLLDLSNARMGDAGVSSLAASLAFNDVLRRIDLAFNAIATDGARALADALATNEYLHELDIRDNEVGDDGAEALAEGLSKNYCLRKLHIARNGVEMHGAYALMKATQHRDDITVDFGACGAGALNPLQVRNMLNRTQTIANLNLVRSAARDHEERERRVAAQNNATSMLFG